MKRRAHRFPRSGITAPARAERDCEPWSVVIDGTLWILVGTRQIGFVTAETLENLRTMRPDLPMICRELGRMHYGDPPPLAPTG